MDADAWKLVLQEQAEARLLEQEIREMSMKQIAVLVCLLSGCVTGADEVTSTVTKSGFTDVKPGRLTLFGCSEDDKAGRLFKAKNAQGIEVSGQVCCGVFKGCTVRF